MARGLVGVCMEFWSRCWEGRGRERGGVGGEGWCGGGWVWRGRRGGVGGEMTVEKGKESEQRRVEGMNGGWKEDMHGGTRDV